MSFLPGQFPAGAAAAGDDALTIEVIATSTEENNPVTIPGSVQAGDIILVVELTIGADAVPSNPSGWTIHYSDNLGFADLLLRSAYRISNGTEGNSTVTFSSGSFLQKEVFCLVLRPSRAVSSITPNQYGGTVAFGSDPPPRTVTSGGGNVPFIALGFYLTNISFSQVDAIFSPTEDGFLEVFFTKLKWRVFNDDPQDVTVDMGNLGDINIIWNGFTEFA